VNSKIAFGIRCIFIDVSKVDQAKDFLISVSSIYDYHRGFISSRDNLVVGIRKGTFEKIVSKCIHRCTCYRESSYGMNNWSLMLK
jgi:hypothetical protein